MERGIISLKSMLQNNENEISKDKPKESENTELLNIFIEKEKIDRDLEKEMPSNLTEEEKAKWIETMNKKDYKRRRQTYRAKLTHLTKRTPIQIQRDLINTTYLLLCDEYGFKLNGEVFLIYKYLIYIYQ